RRRRGRLCRLPVTGERDPGIVTPVRAAIANEPILQGVRSMRVALLAATGRAGSTILAELVRRGHQVAAVARNLDKLPKPLPEGVPLVQDDLSDVDRIVEIIAGADAVVSAYGPPSSDPRYTSDITYTDQLLSVTERLIAAVSNAGAPRLVVVGGVG